MKWTHTNANSNTNLRRHKQTNKQKGPWKQHAKGKRTKELRERMNKDTINNV